MSTTTTTTQKAVTPAQFAAAMRRTKKYKALVSVGLSPEDAAKAYRRVVLGEEPPVEPLEPAVDPIAKLMEAGLTKSQAKKALKAGTPSVPVPVPVPAPAPVAKQSATDALVEKHGFAFAKGRVYVTPAIIEGTVRVTKTGSPEIVTSSGVGRTSAVLLFRTPGGDCAIQNLTKEA